MLLKPLPNGFCIQDVKIWYADEMPGYIGQLRKADSVTVVADSFNVWKVERSGIYESVEQFNNLKSKIKGRDEKEKANIAFALLNLVGSALLERTVTDIVINRLSANIEECSIDADSYISRED